MRYGALLAAGVLSLNWASTPAGAFGLSVRTSTQDARLVDRPLVSSDGERLDFVAEVVRGGPLLISFTFIGCLQQCPVSDAIVDGVVELAEAEGNASLRFATLTINPLDDTPEKLKDRRAAMMIHPARLFLTGEPANVFAVLDGLGLQGRPNEDHLVSYVLVRAADRIESKNGLQTPRDLYAWITRQP